MLTYICVTLIDPQETTGAHGGIRILDPGKRAASDPRPRKRGHRDQRRQKHTTVQCSIPATEIVFHAIKQHVDVYRPRVLRVH